MIMSERFDVYDPGERLIFHHFDGQKVIPADPVVIERRLARIWNDLAVDMRMAVLETMPGEKEDKASERREKAREACWPRIRYAFNLKTLEDGGPTPTECEDLLFKFLSYRDEVKKNSRTSPTTSTPSPESPTSQEGPPTSSTSASGSTGSESSTGGRPRLPVEEALQTAP
jgi:hypothetical protein